MMMVETVLILREKKKHRKYVTAKKVRDLALT